MVNFTPFAKNSLNIQTTLAEAAKDRNIKREDVDFDLLGLETFVQTSKDQEWIVLDESIEKVFDKETLNSSNLQVRQEYKIRIRPYQENSFFKNINMQIASNKAKSKVVATFKKGTIFPCDKNLAKHLKREITRRKLRIGLLSGHFEDGLNATLIKLTKNIPCEKALPKDIRIVIASSSGPILTTDDSVILHYVHSQKQKNNLIDGVNPNELIFEYIKPRRGEDGRNCTGSFITVPEPKVIYSHYDADEETVEKREDRNSVKYYSKINGYVKNTSGLISISKEVSLQSASLRDTGSIDTGENKDISVKINTTDSSYDAVGSGVSIEVKELNVDGTIGSNAKVKATDVHIGEQTHRNSQIEAVENAKVHLHRGNLKAKTAEIEILENGTVNANEVHVKKMLGGEIIGHRVIVEELTSNTIIIASEYIEIHKITGEHNELMIDPNRIDSYHEKVEDAKQRIKTKKTEFKEIKAVYTKNLAQHVERAERIKVFQKRVIAATKAGKAPNKPDMIRIKQYKVEAQRIQEETENLNNKTKEIDAINDELENLYNIEFSARIINKSSYDGHTKIVFKDLKSSEEYTMTPKGVYKELKLQKDGNTKKIVWG